MGFDTIEINLVIVINLIVLVIVVVFWLINDLEQW